MRIASRLIINTLINQKIGTLIIGYNEEWKQKINLGKRNISCFVSVPYNKLIEMLSYKAKMVGIDVIITEESYTSKASFIDNDLIPVYTEGEKNHVTFSGKRVKRGLYCSASIGLINADVNASLNIMRKAVPNVFDYGIEKPVRPCGFPDLKQLAWCCSSPSQGNTCKIRICHI
nr:IS200/IS605 family accessory protein TnpB-related protein [Okeania sp. SIO2C9]